MEKGIVMYVLIIACVFAFIIFLAMYPMIRAGISSANDTSIYEGNVTVEHPGYINLINSLIYIPIFVVSGMIGYGLWRVWRQ